MFGVVAQCGDEDAEVGGEGDDEAPEEEGGKADVHEDGDGEDALLEGGGVRVDVRYVDVGWIEGGVEGLEVGGREGEGLGRGGGSCVLGWRGFRGGAFGGGGGVFSFWAGHVEVELELERLR